MMNTKTSYKCAHNFYDGSDRSVGGEAPGALLDMLAEVASRTLRSESANDADRTAASERPPGDENRDSRRNLAGVLSMPPSQLVKRFALFTGDELKRRYSYECTLVPGCRQKYTSFASESRARVSITTHLARHLDRLRDDDSRDLESAETTQARSKEKVAHVQRVLADETNSKGFEREKERKRDVRRAGGDETVPLDHSYYEQAEEETSVDAAIDEAMSENIMLMVVESDRVRIEELPPRGSAERNDECVEATHRESEEEINGVAPPPAKPKGRAKFIGTSKEEREMALLLMERIKKKGNPSGNNLQCRICDPPRSFTAPTTLVSHYRSHAGIKPYECRLCRSVFTRRHSLKYHMLIHQNQTRFTCADCGKKFRHPSHFREHRRRHTGESPFGCDDCGQRFKTRNTYKRHLKTRHGKVLTTSGELLCLTDEEFQKVQTNRKRKTRSVSLDCSMTNAVVTSAMDEENSTAVGAITDDRGEQENEEIVKTEATDNEIALYDSDGHMMCDVIDEGERQMVRSTIEMLQGYTESGDEARYANVRIEYDDSCMKNENDETTVSYEDAASVEYYDETGSILDEERIEFKEHPHGESGDSNGIILPSVTTNDSSSASITININNNNNDDDIAIFEDESSCGGKQAETITLQVPEKSTFIVLTNNDFKANYVRIGNDGLIIAQK